MAKRSRTSYVLAGIKGAATRRARSEGKDPALVWAQIQKHARVRATQIVRTRAAEKGLETRREREAERESERESGPGVSIDLDDRDYGDSWYEIDEIEDIGDEKRYRQA